MRALTAALAVAALAALAPAQAAASPRPPSPPYMTVLFGRAQYADVTTCDPPTIPADARTLSDAATEMASRGLAGVANVVVDATSTANCNPTGKLTASWAQLAALGWQTISATQDYPKFAPLTASQVDGETCGTLPEFAAQGYSRAWGLMAYPAGAHRYDDGTGPRSGNAQTDIVQHCFAFGRQYGTGINARKTVLGHAGLITTHTVKGGPIGLYQDPATLDAAAATADRPDQWFTIQFYRFRSGVEPGDHNCVGPVATHYVAFNEDYCWEDFLSFLDGLPAGVTVTDPATVACAWGRIPDRTAVTCPPAAGNGVRIDRVDWQGHKEQAP